MPRAKELWEKVKVLPATRNKGRNKKQINWNQRLKIISLNIEQDGAKQADIQLKPKQDQIEF